MPRGKNTKEYQTVKKSYPNLSDAIASVIEKASERLLAAGLINDGQKDAASNGFVDAKKRASTVTGLLLSKVEQDTKYFQMLVDVLQQDMVTFGIVLEQMGITGTVADGPPTGGESEEEAPNGNKRTKLIDPEVPHALCTMEFIPKMKSPPAASTAGPGFAPAALPYESRLWRRKVLKVQIRNRHLLDRWGVKLTKFMECANRWSNGAVSKGSNHIPRFETDDEDPDIIVELNENGDNHSTIGCIEGEGLTQVYLDLSYPDKKYQEHLIVHEFGHALGLGHEHQRSDFWSWIKDYIDENEMEKDVGGRFSDWKRIDGLMDGGATDYDSDSAMHYWCKKSWLTQGYSNKEYLDKQSKSLPKGLKAALYGIHKRDGNVVTEPSRIDLDFLSAKYKKVLPGRSDKESTTPDHVSDTMAHGPPQPDFSGLKEVSTGLLEEITWDGDKKKLRVYAKTAKKWKLIARSLRLEDEEPGCIDEIAMRRSNNNIECVREVFGKWCEDAVGLPNADQFPKSWDGLLNLLTKSQLGEVAKELRIALAAPDSSATKK